MSAHDLPNAGSDPLDPVRVAEPYDRLTMEFAEIRMLAQLIDLAEDGSISTGQTSMLARLIMQKIDAASVHAVAVREGCIQELIDQRVSEMFKEPE